MAANLFSWPLPVSFSDEQAMWRVRTEDDPQAFAQLVGRWQRPIQNLCARMTGDPHRGEDLAQETFARLFSRRRSYEPRGRFSTFLWRMALNLCYDELRKRKRRDEHSIEDHWNDDGFELETDEPGPDHSLVRQEQAEAVRQALLELADPYRAVVVLRHYEGLKFREIAEVLGIPEGTVKSRMAEGLSQLGRRLHPLVSDLPAPRPHTHERLLI